MKAVTEISTTKSNELYGKVSGFMVKRWKEILLYIGFVFIMLFVLKCKVNYHDDELLTYNLSNGKGWLEPVDGLKYEPSSLIFDEYLTSDGSFDIGNVWTRQALDVHPPLYYLIVHIICCMNPGKLSVRYAGIINIVFQLLTLYMFRKIIDFYTQEKWLKAIISVSYIFSAGVLSITSFLRMYVMSGFWVMAITYIHIKNRDKYDYKTYLGLFLITTLGALTHYHFILYAAFLSLTAGLYLISERRFRELLGMILAMLGAGGVSLAIFPSMINHIFLEYRGTGSFDNIKNTSFYYRITDFFGIINREVLGGFLGYVISVICFAAIVDLCSENIKKYDRNEVKKHALIVVPSVCFFLFVSKSAPIISNRYIYPIFPLVLCVIPILFYKVLNKYINNEKTCMFILVLTMALSAASGLTQADWQYLYRESKDAVEYADDHGNDFDAVCFYDSTWKILQSYLELKRFRSVTFYNISSYEEIKTNMRLGDANVVIYAIGDKTMTDNMIEDFKASNPQYVLDNKEQFGYADSYYFVNGLND